MKKDKTLKKDFYMLVLKVCLFTIIASIITYVIVFSTISLSNKNKYADHYVEALNDIENKINNNEAYILQGNMIDLQEYNGFITGELVDINGNHLYGNKDLIQSDKQVINFINREIVEENYIYRFIPIKEDNYIKAIYILKAPFGYVVNNISEHPITTIIYVIALFTPILYFALFLFVFTSKLYKSISRNVNLLLKGSESVSNGNFDFEIRGIQGAEFKYIQKSFNTMVTTLKENIDNLTNLDKERRMMVSSIAHDIRTPITVIKTQLELVDDLKNTTTFNMDKHTEIINKNCDRMTMLTDNLSLLYKVENEKFLLRKEEVNLQKLLEDKILEIKYITIKNNIDIKLETNLTKDKYVLDESMLIRVLNNILYNSLRFTKKGEIILSVYDDENNIYFKCIDTGVGFKQKDTSMLFKAFYQDEDYKNHFGLGLYISQKIVRNFNGEIKAYNNTNGGATVEFYIRHI